MLSPVKVYRGENAALFTSISTEVAALCNRTCVFCPNHDFTRPDKQMPTKLLEKVTDELAELRFSGRWQPYMYNEPLRDDRILDIIRMVRRKMPRVVINVSTNCDYLTSELLDELIDAGVNQMALNIYSARDGNADEEKVAKGVEISRKRAAKMQALLDARPHIDQESSLYTGGSAKRVTMRVLHKYGVQQDGTNFGGDYKIANRSNNVQWLRKADDEDVKYSGTCTRPFRIMEMMWTGDVILCCHDYNGIKSYGNAKTQSLVEIWNNMELHKKREQLQRGVRKGPLCSVCDYGGGAYKHMIHPIQLERPKKT